MANRVIELHDSEVSAISRTTQEITISFSFAYIHESEGVPGVDPGKGFGQKAELLVNGAAMKGALPDFPVEIGEGFLALNGVKSENEIPIPFDFKGDFLIELAFVGGHRLRITGTSATLSLLGSPEYIEDYPG